jgi:hypothetical protein
MFSSAKLFRVAFAIALVLPLALRASAQLTDDERACSDKMNNDARKVLAAEGKNNSKACVKDGAGGDISGCVNAESTKASEKRAQLVTDFGDKCNPLPAFGVTGPGSLIADEAESLADVIIRRIFGSPPDGVVASDKCHQKVAQIAEQQAVAAWKGFRKCLKDADTIPSIATFDACILSGIGDGFDKKQAKLDKAVLKECTTIPPPGMEDGGCGAQVTAQAFSTCIGVRLDCAFCQSVKVITGATADCDLFDDNDTMNNSCP